VKMRFEETVFPPCPQNKRTLTYWLSDGIGEILKNDKSSVPVGLTIFSKYLCQDKNGWIFNYFKETGPRRMSGMNLPKPVLRSSCPT